MKSWLPVSLSSLWLPPPDPFPPAELPDEGLARPVVAGVVATICFLAAAVLFSTLAACFVNKQHRRKLKRKPGQSLSLCGCVPVVIRPCLTMGGRWKTHPSDGGYDLFAVCFHFPLMSWACVTGLRLLHVSKTPPSDVRPCVQLLIYSYRQLKTC